MKTRLDRYRSSSDLWGGALLGLIRTRDLTNITLRRPVCVFPQPGEESHFTKS